MFPLVFVVFAMFCYVFQAFSTVRGKKDSGHLGRPRARKTLGHPKKSQEILGKLKKNQEKQRKQLGKNYEKLREIYEQTTKNQENLRKNYEQLRKHLRNTYENLVFVVFAMFCYVFQAFSSAQIKKLSGHLGRPRARKTFGNPRKNYEKLRKNQEKLGKN